MASATMLDVSSGHGVVAKDVIQTRSIVYEAVVALPAPGSVSAKRRFMTECVCVDEGTFRSHKS